MLHLDKVYSGFSVDDIDRARAFYRDVLGMAVADGEMGMLSLPIGSGKNVLVYPKPNHEPATYTVLNIPTDDIEGAVRDLRAKGVTFEQYEGMTGDDGIARGDQIGGGPDIAWFADPAGNIISVQQSR
jgi:catechol 2,3-dioxygenase-like lactoylglutathione lyase family enzyme